MPRLSCILGLAFASAVAFGASGCRSRPSPAAPPSIDSFTATPPVISLGSRAALSWSVTGADAITIDHGVDPVSGTSQSVNPPRTTTYTLTATNAAGSTSAEVTVTVLFGGARIYEVAPGARAIALGDFNRDGITDLAVLGDTVSVLLGTGGGAYESATEYQVEWGSHFSVFAAADVNGDGALDLVAVIPSTDPAQINHSTVRLLLGLGDGTFQPGEPSPVGFLAGTGAIGDFNRDGRPDLALVHEVVEGNLARSDGVAVLLGDGDGTFQAPRDLPAPGAALIAVADFDRDGIPDLAAARFVGGDLPGTISMYLGNGDGTFRHGADYVSADTAPGYVLAGDFEGDGVLDLVVANNYSSSVSVFPGKGDGTFRSRVDHAIGAQPGPVTSGDFNADGKLDLATRTVSRLIVIHGNGDGTFQPRIEYANSMWGGDIVAADFTGHGRSDLAITNGGYPGELGVVLLGSDGVLQVKRDYAMVPDGGVSGDFDADGVPDLAVVDTLAGVVSILLGEGDGLFRAAGNYAMHGCFEAFGAAVPALTVADLNGDGRPDIAVPCRGGADGLEPGSVRALFGVGDGTFQLGPENAVGVKPVSVSVGDFDGDGTPDLAVVNNDFRRLDQGWKGSVRVLLGGGRGGFRTGVDYEVGVNPTAGAVGDFDGNGHPDLAVLKSSRDAEVFPPSDVVTVFLNQGDGTFPAKVDYPVLGVYSESARVQVGDFNGDGQLDIAVTGIHDWYAISFILGNGDGTFQATVQYQPYWVSPMWITSGDLDQDGALDLVFANAAANTVGVLLGDGQGGFPNMRSSEAGVGSASVAIGDFNSDGKPDLAVANEGSDTVTILLGDGRGAFPARHHCATAPFPHALAAADFDRDGHLDLAVVGRAGLSPDEFSPHTLSILLGTGDGTFKPRVDYTSGQGSLAAADFDGDGAIDLAVADGGEAVGGAGVVKVLMGNGDGTFRSGQDLPTTFSTSVAVGDFNRDGKLDLAVANGRARRDGQWWGEGTVGVFLGVGDGTFVTSGAYDVHSGPVFVAVGDFNQDGEADLIVVNRGWGTVSVLLGYGDGTFQARLDYSAGADPGAVTVGDFDRDGRPDLAIANGTSPFVSVLRGECCSPGAPAR